MHNMTNCTENTSSCFALELHSKHKILFICGEGTTDLSLFTDISTIECANAQITSG